MRHILDVAATLQLLPADLLVYSTSHFSAASIKPAIAFRPGAILGANP